MPRFYDVMRSEENKVVFGTLSGHAYHLGVSPRLYRTCILVVVLMAVYLSHWLVVPVLILVYIAVSMVTPNYDPMYDSSSPKFDERGIPDYW